MKPPSLQPAYGTLPKDDYVSTEFVFKPTEHPGEFIAIKASGERKLFHGVRSECYTAAAKWTLLKTQPATQTKAPADWIDPDFQPQPDDENE